MALEIAKTIVSARTVVPNAATRVRLSTASVEIFRIDVSADLGNTNPMLLGSSDVVAASGSQKGVVLIPGNSPITVYIDNLNKLYVDAQTDGDAITYNYYRHH